MKNFVVIDIESSDMDPEQGELLGINAVKVKNGKLVEEEYRIWFSPKNQPPEASLAILQKDREFFKDRPSAPIGIEGVLNFCGDDPVFSILPEYCLFFLQKAGMDRKFMIGDALQTVRGALEGLFPYNDESFTWNDWQDLIFTPKPHYEDLKNDDFDSRLVAFLMLQAFSGSLRAELESFGIGDD
jgi:hypothetical protein